MRSKNLDLARASDKRYYTANHRAFWIRNLRNKYGITEAQYSALYDAQGGRCAVCGCIPNERLAVDHDHETGVVRGLLCRRCNLELGHWTVVKLRAAIAYLETETSPPPPTAGQGSAEMRGRGLWTNINRKELRAT